MNKFLGLLFVVLGAYLLFKTLFAGWILFLLLAAGLALGAAIGAIGRWAFAAAGVLALIALPGMLFRSVFFGLALVIKAAPLLLLLYGVYLLTRAVK